MNFVEDPPARLAGADEIQQEIAGILARLAIRKMRQLDGINVKGDQTRGPRGAVTPLGGCTGRS
jgi:hypothetical protein